MKKLILIALFAAFGGAFAAPNVFVIDTTRQYQTFSGWGASQRNLSFQATAWRQAVDSIYGAEGLNFNAFRATIYPDASYANWTNVTDESQGILINTVKSKGANLFYAAPLTPPAQLKKNGKISGDYPGDTNNTIEANVYPLYARHIAYFLKGYKEYYSTEFQYVTLQNEPDVSSTDASCLIGYENYKDFVKVAGDEFASQGITTKILAPETSGWNASFSYLQRIYSNSDISKYLSGISTHSYRASQNREIISNFAEGKGIKEIWQTQWSDTLGSNSNPDDIQNAIKWSQTIMSDLNEGSVTAWFVASLFGQKDSSLVPIDGSNAKITKRYYAMGQFSKYIRPGYRRISAESASTKISLTAWISGDGKTLSIVAVNPQTTSSDLSVALPFGCATDFAVRKTQTSATENLAHKQDIFTSDGVLKDALEPRAIVTYVINISGIQPAPQVALTAPTAGAVAQPISINFNWDVFPGADKYSFVLSKDASFADTVSEQAANVPGANVANLERSTTYYWRVKAFKQATVIACSPVVSFKTINNLPAKVTLALPAEGKELSPDKVLFAWNQSSPAVDRYEIQLSFTEDFAQIEKTKTVSGNNTDFTGLKEYTKYWWRVRAGNDGGLGEWSSVRTFTTTKSASIYESLPLDAIKLSPNPANNLLRYELSFAPIAETTISIYDANGSLMLENRNVAISGSLDVRYIPAGTYFLVVESTGSAAVEQFNIVR